MNNSVINVKDKQVFISSKNIHNSLSFNFFAFSFFSFIISYNFSSVILELILIISTVD